jgi:NAD-specific glutamate dehydrogenase
VRQKIQQVLMDRLKASDCEFWTFFSESVLARVQLILRVDPKNRIDIDPLQLEKEVVQACRSWQDDYSAWWWKASAKPTAPTCWRTSRKASRPVTASALPRIRRWSTCSTC